THPSAISRPPRLRQTTTTNSAKPPTRPFYFNQTASAKTGAIQAEIDRTSEQTDFNGVKVLAGNNKLTIQVGANDGETIDIDLKQIDRSALGLDGFSVASNALNVGPKITSVAAAAGTGSFNVSFSAGDITKINTATGKTFAAADLELHEIKNASGANTGQFVVKAGDEYFAASVNRTNGAVVLNGADVSFTDPDNGINAAVTLQDQLVRVGSDGTAAVGYVTVQGKNYVAANTLVDGGATPTANVGVSVALSGGSATLEFAGVATGNPLAKIDAALKQVDDLRSSLGAVQNRFDSVISNLGTTVTNLSASRSRIQDADYATEVSNMTRAQILQQAGTSVLAQANQTTQNVLSLLR
ncbi:hypothetical protein F1599_02085, partial [Cupriavidus cauae]